ncbi:hypothetical protein ABZ926_12365 [Streptomyces litmocidini]|uniref:acyl-CoA-like ligand-binding transcription factor n=1 Tax=Streptomyces litmocidini TaxID=67318 RepID=UPI0034048AB1
MEGGSRRWRKAGSARREFAAAGRVAPCRWRPEPRELILTVPELQANSTLRCAAWHALVEEFEEFEEFAAERLRRPVDALMPQALAHGVLGAATAAFERWLHDEEADLGRLLDLLFTAGRPRPARPGTDGPDRPRRGALAVRRGAVRRVRDGPVAVSPLPGRVTSRARSGLSSETAYDDRP